MPMLVIVEPKPEEIPSAMSFAESPEPKPIITAEISKARNGLSLNLIIKSIKSIIPTKNTAINIIKPLF